MPGKALQRVIDDQGDQEQDEKIKAAEKKTKKILPATFLFAREESGKKCNKDIDAGDAQGDCLFAERKAVEQQGKQKEKERGQQIRKKQILQNKGKAAARIFRREHKSLLFQKLHNLYT